MLASVFKNKMDKFAVKNKTLTIAIICLSISVVYLSWALVSKVDEQKIVVVPPATNLKEFWIQGNQVSTSYLEMMADSIAYNVLNVTEYRNVNVDFVLSLVPAEYIEKVRTSLLTQKNYILNNGLTQVFFINSYHTEQKGLIKVIGLLKRYVREKQVSSEVYSFYINYNISRGRFWLTSINLKRGKE